MDFDLYSLKNNLVKAIKAKMKLTLKKAFVPGVKFPFYTSGVILRLFGLICNMSIIHDSVIIVAQSLMT